MEADLGASDMVSVQLTSLKGDKEEKRARLQRSEADKSKANCDARLVELASRASKLEENREELANELQFISMNSESRAKLDLKKDEFKRRRVELNGL